MEPLRFGIRASVLELRSSMGNYMMCGNVARTEALRNTKFVRKTSKEENTCETKPKWVDTIKIDLMK